MDKFAQKYVDRILSEMVAKNPGEPEWDLSKSPAVVLFPPPRFSRRSAGGGFCLK